MKKQRLSFGKVCWVVATALLLLLPWTARAQRGDSTDDLVPQLAPRPTMEEADHPPGTGFIPPQMDLSHITVPSAPAANTILDGAPMALPDVWDWRTQDGGRVTPVKNQGGCGSCYAFGALGNIESKMLMDGEGTWDFSENNAKECNWREVNNYQNPPGTPWGSCDGGNYPMLVQLLAEKGTPLETADPYVDSDVACNSSVTYQKTLLDYREISGSTMPVSDVLRSYIHTYGPIKTSMDVQSPEFDVYTGTYTLDYVGSGTNHAVMIVGWSNNLSPTLSNPGVPAAGWIVKNSWGTGWGDGGYFYVEYGAANVGLYSSFMYDWQDYDPDGTLMSYIDDTWTGNIGCSNTSAWGLAGFTPSSDTYATNIEFWTNDITTTVDVYLYDDFNRSTTTLSNLLAQSTGNVYPEVGYHSILLNSPVPLTSGDEVFAVVHWTTDSYTYPIPLDDNGTIETALTYLSCSGNDGSWADASGWSADVALSLRTSTCPKHYPGLTVGSGEAFTLSCDITVEGDLEVQSGGALDLGTHDITVTGLVTNSGTISQTKSVTTVGAGVEFMHITDRAGTTDKYFGVAITPTVASMGDVTVAIKGNQVCSSGDSAVMRCFEITPGTVQTATVTFYYRDAEENGEDAAHIWHWTGSSWEQEAFDSRDRTGVEGNWVRVTGVDAYSPFAASNGSPTAVSLASFEAVPSGAAVLVTWETAMETETLGFNVWRSTALDGGYVQVNDALIPSQSPGSTFGAEYAWLDETVEPGVIYYYKLEDIEEGDVSTFHGPISVSQGPNAISVTAPSARGVPLAVGLVASVLFLGGVGFALVRRTRRRD